MFRSSSTLPRLGKLPTGKSAVISVLDIGSSKICCMIARLRPREGSEILPGRSHTIEVLGLGHQRSRGIKSGTVVDMDEAEKAIRLAVDSAERQANMTVDSLIVSVSAGRIASDTCSSQVDLGGREVRTADISAVLAAGFGFNQQEGRTPVHALPIGFKLDAQRGIASPEGMVGNNLSVDMQIVSAEIAPLRNIEMCVNRAHLSVDGMVAAPYAAGLSALVEDEARMGAACVDLGGGTTTVSIFFDGNLVFADAVAVGGNHVTMDLARCLSIRVSDAERLKVLHGTALASVSDETEVLSVASIEEGNANPIQVSVAQVSQIIRPRIEETFELLRDRINRSGYASVSGRRVVLTGGASQLSGVTDVAATTLGANIRLGRPMGVSGLPSVAKGPAFSCAAGLMIFPQISANEYASGLPRARTGTSRSNGPLARMGQWLKESF